MMKEKTEKKESAKKSEKVDKTKELEIKIGELEAKCEEFEAKASEANDKYVRMAAEFDNYRRRTAKEKLELVNTAGEDVIKGLLPILDDCERALMMLKESKADDSAIEGTELILNKLFGYLKTKGVEKIEAVGKELDTDFHEAVAQFPVEDPEKKNKIIDVVQQGYLLHEKVIRYAKVVVGI
jgi:molecular chaperone GrpE